MLAEEQKSSGSSLGAVIRGRFPLLAARKVVYLDSAASSQKPDVVLDAMDRLYRHSYANVHRGLYALSEEASEAYEKSRSDVANFVRAKSDREIIFCRGTTEGLNLIANSLGRKVLKKGDEVLLTIAEHHSNIVPWQLLQKELGFTIKFAKLTPDLDFDAEDFKSNLSEKTKIVSFTHVSNALGVTSPLTDFIKAAKSVGAYVIIDGAQAAAHRAVDVQAIGVDFYTFSGHKIYGPTGVGIVYGREQLLEEIPPYMGGGEMISSVTTEGVEFAELPHKFEAGTPAIAEAIGLSAAVRFIREIGFDSIEKHDKALILKLESTLASVEGVTVLGNSHASAASFTCSWAHPHDIAQYLDRENIAVRAGHHCAQPLMDYLGIGSSTRVSLGVYNTEEELDFLGDVLRSARKFFDR